MKSNWLNNVHVEGYVFNHTLTNRVTGENSKNPGTPFIMGDLNIATDDEGMNVVSVHFTYVTETYAKSGKPNATYAILQQIIDGVPSFEAVGTDATKVRVDGDMEINDFVTRDGEMASPKRIRGSFVHTMNKSDKLADRPATFEIEGVFTNYSEREVEQGDNYGIVKGYAFNFRGDALPFDVTIKTKPGMDWFENQDLSSNNPLVTKIWGDIVSTVIKTEKETESAFGAPQVDVTTRTIRAWEITGTSVEPMEWDDESTITKAEMKQALDAREEHLAEVRKRDEEYRAKQNGNGGNAFAQNATAAVTSPTANDDFAF